jgi:hypothetical protein
MAKAIENAAGGEGFVERRRLQRVRLIQPLRGVIGQARIFVVDLSLRGLRVAHQDAIGRVGENVLLKFEYEGRSVTIRCDIRHTALFRPAETASGRATYHSGLEVSSATESAAGTLRDIVVTHVLRALDEQKANARGLPAVSPQSFQTGKTSTYVRHEFILGTWRTTATSDAKQPERGFTVSAEHTPAEVEMLRSAFEMSTTREDRDFIRKMAEMSIGTKDGIPTRRFEP